MGKFGITYGWVHGSNLIKNGNLVYSLEIWDRVLGM